MAMFMAVCLVTGCGSTSSDSGDTGTTLAAIVFPTSLATDLSAVAGVVGENVARALPDDDSFVSIKTDAPYNAEQLWAMTDTLLAKTSGMECAAATGNTTCTFTSTSNTEMKIDFSPHDMAFPFSANNVTTLAGIADVTCVADTNTELTAGTGLCFRLWEDDVRGIIGVFTTRPTATDKGAGWMIMAGQTSAGGFGNIYDKSTATAAVTDGPYSYIETFANVPGQYENTHYFATQTAVSGSASALVNFNTYMGIDTPTQTDVVQTARWHEYWYGKFVSGAWDSGSSGTDALCGFLEGGMTGSTASCLADSLTSPDLPDYLGLAVAADWGLPSTEVFPETATF